MVLYFVRLRLDLGERIKKIDIEKQLTIIINY